MQYLASSFLMLQYLVEELQIKCLGVFFSCCSHLAQISFDIEVQCCACISVSLNLLYAFNIRSPAKK